MKKAKLMHTLLSLALSYGTFSSQAMASESPPTQYTEYDYANLGTISDPSLDENGDPEGYTPITLEETNFGASPNFANTSGAGNIVSSMQNIRQSAYATNTANLTNRIDITGMDGSDLVNNMTVNTNAMNSNVGSSYNNSTNNITTYTENNSENNSINDYTTTLDSNITFK
jgi:hypothetical protein